MPGTSGKSPDQISSTASANPPGEASPRERVYRNRTSVERRAERRDKLLEAAKAAFADQGYARTSIEHLCAAAGISTRNFYEEFARKEDVLFALYDTVNGQALEAALAATRQAPLDVVARAQAGVRAYLRVMTADPRLARISYVESVGVSAEMERHRSASYRGFAALIEQQAGELMAAGFIPRRDFSLTAIALVGAVKELGVATVSGEADGLDVRIERAADEAARLVVAAILTPSLQGLLGSA